MIEINLLPQPKRPDKDLQRVLNPSVAYLIDIAYEHAKLAKTEEDLLVWGRYGPGYCTCGKNVFCWVLTLGLILKD